MISHDIVFFFSFSIPEVSLNVNLYTSDALNGGKSVSSSSPFPFCLTLFITLSPFSLMFFIFTCNYYYSLFIVFLYYMVLVC